MTKPMAALIIAAVVVVDLLLIRVARQGLETDPVDGSNVVASTSESPAAGPAGSFLVSLAEDGTIAHAPRGVCADGAEIALTLTTVDGDEDPVAVNPGVTEVLRIEAVDADTLYVEGTTDDCAAVVERLSDDGGETWRDASGDIEWWHYAPGSTTSIITLAGVTDPGCTLSALAQTDGDVGAVGCSDGRVLATEDGTTWTEVGVLDGLRALAFATDETGGAVSPDDDCPLRFRTTGDAGATWDPAGCVPGDGSVALAVRDATAVAVVDGVLSVSTDGGTSWG